MGMQWNFGFAGLGLVICISAASPTRAGDFDEPESFNAPSNNISCHYTPKGELPRQTSGIYCTRFAPTPARMYLGQTGKVTTQRGFKDGCCDNSPVLAYGKTWERAPFSCHSSEAGMRCTRADGRGFLMSRSKLEAF